MLKITRWSESINELREMCQIEGLIAHDYIPDPDHYMDNWHLRYKACFKDKLIITVDNTIIGCAYLSQGRQVNKTNLYFELYINPDYHRSGHGTTAFKFIYKQAKDIGCKKLFTYIYDHPNWDAGKLFLEKNNFRNISTNREYSLALQKTDFIKYETIMGDLKEKGISFKEPRMNALNTEEHYQKLEALRWAFFRDMPYPEGITPIRPEYSMWIKAHKQFEKNNYGIEIIAVNRKDEYVGCTKLECFKTEPRKCWTSNLGVLQNYRRQGIATGLKITALQKLKKLGFTEIRTDNEENNPMYKINVEMGFQPVPFSMEYLKEI